MTNLSSIEAFLLEIFCKIFHTISYIKLTKILGTTLLHALFAKTICRNVAYIFKKKKLSYYLGSSINISKFTEKLASKILKISRFTYLLPVDNLGWTLAGTVVRTFLENNDEKRRQLRWYLSNGSNLTKGAALKKKFENEYIDLSNNICHTNLR